MIKSYNDVLSRADVYSAWVRPEDGLVVTPNSELITPNSEAIASAGPRSSVVELLICNQRVGGSNPSVGSKILVAQWALKMNRIITP